MRRILMLSAVAIALLTTASPVTAATPRYTRGYAQLMFNTYPGPGGVWGVHDWPEGLDIRPFDFYGDSVYCVNDWHVLALAWFGYSFSVPEIALTWSSAQARAETAGLEFEFTLDGEPMATTSSTVRPFRDEANRAWTEEYLEQDIFASDVIVGAAWGVQHGRILAPGELTVGPHTMTVLVPDSPYPFTGPWEGTVDFEVSNC